MNYLTEKNFDNELLEITSKCFLFAIIGLILGMAINILANKTINVLKMSRLLRVFIQLACCSFAFALIKVYAPTKFVNDLLDTTQGLFFIAVFFGVQYSMFDEIQSYTEMTKQYVNKQAN